MSYENVDNLWKKYPQKLGYFRYYSYVCYMRINYLIGVNRGGNANPLIINELDKTTKIITQMFGSFTFFSYLYLYQTTKRYGLPS
jgi:hypothetical protein